MGRPGFPGAPLSHEPYAAELALVGTRGSVGAQVAAPVQSAAGDAGKGKPVYDSACAACHAAGVAGAPKFGDKAAWAARIKSGMDTLYASALKGKGAMPPKGGNPGLGDAEVKAAVDYMVGSVK